jgi:hypothetical protein
MQHASFSISVLSQAIQFPVLEILKDLTVPLNMVSFF